MFHPVWEERDILLKYVDGNIRRPICLLEEEIDLSVVKRRQTSLGKSRDLSYGRIDKRQEEKG